MHACSEAAAGRHKVCIVESVEASTLCDAIQRCLLRFKMQHVLVPLVVVVCFTTCTCRHFVSCVCVLRFCFVCFHLCKVCFLWALGSIMVQYIADDIGYNQPFIFTYIGSCALSSCLPIYLACSWAGLAPNPPFRSEEGRSVPPRYCIVSSSPNIYLIL